MSPTLKFATQYLRLGLAVLPLHHPVQHNGRLRCSCGKQDCTSPAKHPFARLVANGLLDASKDPSVVDRWFREAKLNLGIATGAASGIIVLDIDPRHGGDDALRALEQQHEMLPPTWRFLTGGGGEHILFRHPGGVVPNSASRIGRGIDLRGDGGYVVAPPSQHISGRTYAVSVDHHPDDVGLAECPAWLLDLNGTSIPGKKAAAKPARHWRAVVRQPRAIILKGETAENGKSQILDLARGLLPPSAICSVTAGRMGDERHIIGLVGKLLNASDELSSAAAIASETFKAVVTGEPVQGRDVYKSRVEFRPVAQHLFATNTLPVFAGGMDRGVQRRLLVIPFHRVIPTEERIEAIGRRIAEEEADLLLAWAVDGAARLIRRRDFAIPASSKAALNDWLYGADPVLAWLDERVEVRPIIGDGPKLRTSYAHEQFQAWALAEGFKRDTLPAVNGFVQRIKANAPGIAYRRSAEGRFFLGMVVRHFTPPSSFA